MVGSTSLERSVSELLIDTLSKNKQNKNTKELVDNNLYGCTSAVAEKASTHVEVSLNMFPCGSVLSQQLFCDFNQFLVLGNDAGV